MEILRRMTRKKTHKETEFDAERGQEARYCAEQRHAGRRAGHCAGADAPPRPEELRLLEALLFAAGAPLDEATLARRLPNDVDVKDALARLKAEYATRGVNLVRVGKKWMFRTADDLSWLLTKETVETRKLSRAAIETLAIIAYHQPVTRAEIEEIRGVVAAAGTLDVLLETGWIRPRGRRKAPGRPITYGTTEQFLSHFGLEEVGDLPGLDELKGAGLLEGNLPPGFAVPLPSDDTDACATTRIRSNPAISTLVSPRRPRAVRARPSVVIAGHDPAIHEARSAWPYAQGFIGRRSWMPGQALA